MNDHISGDDLTRRLAPLTSLRGAGPLTAAIAALEYALAGCRTEDIATRLQEQGVSTDLLRAAFYARSEFGRINDVIHAIAIATALLSSWSQANC